MKLKKKERNREREREKEKNQLKSTNEFVFFSRLFEE